MLSCAVGHNERLPGAGVMGQLTIHGHENKLVDNLAPPICGQPRSRAERFILALAFANTALFQWPLYALAASTRASLDWSSALASGRQLRQRAG